MEFIRYTREMYGQETLQGISWDLLPVVTYTGLVIIIAHFLYKMIINKK